MLKVIYLYISFINAVLYICFFFCFFFLNVRPWMSSHRYVISIDINILICFQKVQGKKINLPENISTVLIFVALSKFMFLFKTFRHLVIPVPCIINICIQFCLFVSPCVMCLFSFHLAFLKIFDITSPTKYTFTKVNC